MYSRRTSVKPSPSVCGLAASSSCRCASTPSLRRPGSTPSSYEVSWKISSRVIRSSSPALLTTRHTPGASSSRQGGLIQFSGLYARSSAWIDTDPSAFTISSRVAGGRWAESRPT